MSLKFPGILYLREEVAGMDQSAKETVYKNITLCYYNRFLRDAGVITEREFHSLMHLINTKYPIPQKER